VKGDLNFLNFEHTAYLPEDVVNQLLAQKGFLIVDREYFREHSIFLTAEKIAEPEPGFSFSSTPEYLTLFHEYFKSLEKKFNVSMRSLKSTRGLVLFCSPRFHANAYCCWAGSKSAGWMSG